MTEDNDKRGPPPTPPKEGSVKQMTEDNDKRGPPPAPPKEGSAKWGNDKKRNQPKDNQFTLLIFIY